MKLHTIGIDLGKTVFHLVGLDLRGEVVVRKKFSRTQLLRFTANVRVELIGMEACGGAHFLGRAPVSYTHLDVYKRQDWSLAKSASRTAEHVSSRRTLPIVRVSGGVRSTAYRFRGPQCSRQGVRRTILCGVHRSIQTRQIDTAQCIDWAFRSPYRCCAGDCHSNDHPTR